MGFLKSLVLAFSCFSSIPMPSVPWDERNMRYLMACFPLVGVAVGASIALWCWAAQLFAFGPVLRAVGVVVVPLVVTGGIHLDGFADVVDALSSHADAERKREILKDPHVGAFAVIGVGSYLLVYLGVAAEMPSSWQAVALMALAHVVERCESSFATVAFKGSSEGMLSSFRNSADKRVLVSVLVEYALGAAAMVLVCPVAGAAALACGLACLAFVHLLACRQFGGMSGDIAGFLLQVCEVVMLAAIAFAAKAVGL